jgi:hypothetical protein
MEDRPIKKLLRFFFTKKQSRWGAGEGGGEGEKGSGAFHHVNTNSQKPQTKRRWAAFVYRKRLKV